MLQTPSDCKDVAQLGFILAIYFSTDLSTSVKDFANDCFKKMEPARTFAHNGLELPVFRSESKSKAKRGNQVEQLLQLNAKLSSMKDVSAKENRTDVKKILKTLEGRTDTAAQLLAAAVYMELGNQARAARLLKQIQSTQLHTNTFFYVGEKPRSQLAPLMDAVLKKIYQLSGNENLIRALGLKLAIEGDDILAQFVLEQWDVELDDEAVEQLSKSHIYGRPLLGGWIGYYLEQKTEGYIYQLLLKSGYFERLEKKNLSQAWVLAYDLNVPKGHQNNVTDVIRQLQNSSSLYHQDVYFKLMSNSRLRNLQDKNGQQLDRPLFTVERNFYKSLLAKSVATEYALFKLLSMGDSDLNYLGHLYGN